MNRSILIVICDFLLVSLLAFSTIEPDKLSGDATDRRVKMDMTPPSGPDTRQDLATVMKLALDEERQTRDQLLEELAQSRAAATQQLVSVSERDRALAERDRQIQAYQQTLQTKEQQARQLAREKSWLEQQVAGSQTNLQNLQRQLVAANTDSTLTRELASTTREELRREQEKAAALQQQLAQMEKSQQAAQAEKQQLASRLQVAEAEKRAAADRATRMQDEVKVVREEKERLTQHADKLADGVKTLASQSGDLAREIRDNRPLAPNTIFNEFSTNRVHANFHAYRPGILGLDLNRKRDTEVILTSDGTNHYALCHAEETPTTPANSPPEWISLTGNLGRNTALISIRSLSFALADPRVVFMPITPAEAAELGARVYRIAPDPFKFQDAVLVGAREGYYGECKFEIDLTAPQYLKMDHSFVRGMFGKFNPSRGDLVFSRNGDLLGIMVNNTYCLRLTSFAAVATLRFGPDVREQHPADLLGTLQSQIFRLPFKLK